MGTKIAATLMGALVLGGCGGVPLPEAKIRSVSGYVGFVADTSNIGCVMDTQSIRCDISKRAWKPPKDRAKCQLDYGQGIWLRRDSTAKFVCAGDTTLYAGDRLGKGHGLRSGDMVCVVQRRAVVCKDESGGHGFEISAKRYRLF